MIRYLIAWLMIVGLGGCGMVTSTRPLFGPSDFTGAPSVKPGLWALFEQGCKFNLQAPPGKWPKCAFAMTLSDGTISDPTPDPQGNVDDPVDFQIVAGDPAIVQVKASSHEVDYVYFGFRPMAVDQAGLVTQARIWAALCAKPAAQEGAKPSRPLPGLITNAGGDGGCEARAARPLRNAVAQSETWLFPSQDHAPGWTGRWVSEMPRRALFHDR